MPKFVCIMFDPSIEFNYIWHSSQKKPENPPLGKEEKKSETLFGLSSMC
jgi:hypothetical protein